MAPRPSIRPGSRGGPGAGTGVATPGAPRRFLPLWLQLLVFGAVAAFLTFVYFALQGGASDNPFPRSLQG